MSVSNDIPRARAVDSEQIRGTQRQPAPDTIAIEEPLEIRLGRHQDGALVRQSVSITMRTPGNDEELAVGFLHGEGILPSADALGWVGRCPVAPAVSKGNILRVDLAEGVAVDLKRLERHFYTTSSCGVCGKTSLEALSIRGITPLGDSGPRIRAEVLVGLPDRLRAAQRVFDETGGLHAAAMFSPDGQLRLIREDVGRHNALDKVVGRLLLDRQLPADDGVLLLSGRTSFELMQKALVAGVQIVAAVGAPSSLAVDLAQQYGITLAGFLRGDRFNIYANGHRILS